MQSVLDQMDAQELGQALRQAREERGLTQQAASEIIGVSRTTITAIETGERRIKASELVQLARAYDRAVGDFVNPDPLGLGVAFDASNALHQKRAIHAYRAGKISEGLLAALLGMSRAGVREVVATLGEIDGPDREGIPVPPGEDHA